MDLTNNKLMPFVQKVGEEFGEDFRFSREKLEYGVFIFGKIGYTTPIMLTNIVDDKFLMTIMVGGGVLNIDILIKTPEELAENITRFMPFIEALREDDEEDEDEPVQYSVSINEDEINTAFEEMLNKPSDWKPTFFD